jgi:hypothetical protein
METESLRDPSHPSSSDRGDSLSLLCTIVVGVVESVIGIFPNSLCLTWKNPWQDTWVKMQFIKLGREIQNGAWWAQVESGGRELLLFSRCF